MTTEGITFIVGAILGGLIVLMVMIITLQGYCEGIRDRRKR